MKQERRGASSTQGFVRPSYPVFYKVEELLKVDEKCLSDMVCFFLHSIEICKKLKLRNRGLKRKEGAIRMISSLGL